MTTNETRTVFEKAHAAIEAANTGYVEHVNAHAGDVATMRNDLADPRGHITDQDAARIDIAHSNKLRAFADTDTAKAIDNAVEAVRARHNQAQAHIDQIRENLSPAGDTAAELRATRFWNRTKEVLDSITDGNGGPDPDGVRRRAEQIIATAKPDELGTFLQEIEAFCETRRIPTTGWLEQTLTQVVPDYVRAKQSLQRATQALSLTEGNARMVRDAITSGHPAPMALARPNSKYDPDR